MICRIHPMVSCLRVLWTRLAELTRSLLRFVFLSLLFPLLSFCILYGNDISYLQVVRPRAKSTTEILPILLRRASATLGLVAGVNCSPETLFDRVGALRECIDEVEAAFEREKKERKAKK